MKTSSKRPTDFAKFLSLNWPHKWLLVRALVVMMGYKLVLLILPFRRLVKRTPSFSPSAPSAPAVESVAWAIQVVSRKIPFGFTCLVQAIAAKQLLKNHPDVRLCIGVRKSAFEEFSAHAWLACGDRIILGEQTAQAFKPIAEWN